tara:strand:+ start:236 stop:475 length:240 start_codon:yes stop_codon:yes gene_type:complete
MTNQNINPKKPILTFEGKKYFIDKLPEEVKEIIKNLQIADTQLKMHEDTLKLLAIGRNTLTNELRKKLNNLNQKDIQES